MIEIYLRRKEHENKSNKWVELNVIKEYLISEQMLIHREIQSIEKLKIVKHLENILLAEMNRRLDQITYLLNNIIYEINNLDNERIETTLY